MSEHEELMNSPLRLFHGANSKRTYVKTSNRMTGSSACICECASRLQSEAAELGKELMGVLAQHEHIADGSNGAVIQATNPSVTAAKADFGWRAELAATGVIATIIPQLIRSGGFVHPSSLKEILK
eukprot:scaffold529726_cov47-Prasinocladus_malaysianus.AAC.2